MTIVKPITEVPGGTLALSGKLGQGTTVTLWLPCVDSLAAKSAQTRDDQMLQVVTEFPAG